MGIEIQREKPAQVCLVNSFTCNAETALICAGQQWTGSQGTTLLTAALSGSAFTPIGCIGAGVQEQISLLPHAADNLEDIHLPHVVSVRMT